MFTKNIRECDILDDIVVATEDERICKAVKDFGGKAVLTSPDHQTGTDRIAEAARHIEADIIVNVQGDEPLVKSEMIEKIANPLIEDSSINVANLISLGFESW